MIEFLEKLFDSDYMPHGHCYMWSTSILWLNVFSDIIITLSYYSIPIALYYFVRRRRDLSFDWIIVLFALFILACGTTHLIEVWNVWHGTYRLAGVVKLITAALSISTAYLLWRNLPKLLSLPSSEAIQRALKNLELEVQERKNSERTVMALNSELEQRVQIATTELSMALAHKEEVLLREREARTESEKASKLKDEFLTTLSHELRTPLNAISTWTQLLISAGPGDQKFLEAIPVLQRNVKLLSDIIEDLLDMSAIFVGAIKLNLTEIDFKVLIDSVINSLEPTAAIKQVSIIRDFTPDNVKLRGDAGRVRQIIWNLLSNSIKFSNNGGSVTLVLKVEKGQAVLKLRDQGRGISAEFLPFVFERFRQEVATTTREYAGLGLGLAIAKQLTELHAGEVRVVSEGLGKGAEFTLLLPVTV